MTTQPEITDEELERIEQLCRAAAPAPWRSFIEGRDHWGGSDFIQASDRDIELSGASHADQDFIASARQDVPRLVAEVRRLREALAATKKDEAPPKRMEEVLLNQLAQSVRTSEEGGEWFRAQDLAKQRGILRSLATFASQAGARPSDADAAIARSGLRPGHTPAVLLRAGPLRVQLAKILALRADEHERAFRLLLSLFAIADARRRSSECTSGCSHWWHRDLSDSAVVASIGGGE